MLKLIHTISDLNFAELMNVYSESNMLNGAELYGNLTESEQLYMAEMDFYHYLNSVFFRQFDSFYAVWELSGRYISALRIEPYMDGYLLCALETSPQERRKGHACSLIHNVQEYLAEQGSGVLYSHVSKRNPASLRVHTRCGFEAVKDYAVYSDGSVLRNHYTLAYTYRKSEIL